MRLPQSISQSLLTRVFLFISATVLAVIMPLSAGAKAQQLTVSPYSLHFGSVLIGQSETEVAVLTNSGSTSVTLSAVNSSVPGFTASGLSLPATLSPGQSVSLKVTFSPVAVGWQQGGITFTSIANRTYQLGVGGSGATSDGLVASPASVSFGQVNVGAKSTVPVVLKNMRTWKTTLYGFQMTGTGFSVSGPTLPITLNPGQSVSVNLTFTPKSTGTSGGYVFVSGPDVNIPLNGSGTTTTTAGQLTVAPTAVNFGNVSMGSTATQTMTMSASGASVTVSADSSSSSQFAMTGVSFPFTIPAGQSSSFTAAFKPTTTGTVSGSLSFTSNASNGSSMSVPLSGTGTTAAAGQLTIAPASLNFGDVNVGSTGTQAITMSASGASVTVSSDASSSSQFVMTGASLPFTIPAGQSLSFNVGFAPTAAGTVSGSLSFTSNASTSKTVESLTGIGTTAQYSVSLSWNASSGVVGYNIYRSTSANGTYARINSTVDANTAFTDTTVAAGQTYYYEATAVNSAGQESARSTPPVQAAVP